MTSSEDVRFLHSNDLDPEFRSKVCEMFGLCIGELFPFTFKCYVFNSISTF